MGLVKDIDGYTRTCGLIGSPVGHSLSPLLHNFAFQSLGLNYRYLAYEVRPENLEAALRGFAVLNFAGINVTAPFKGDVIPMIDRLDREAVSTGSVNTICFREGRLEGHTTDGKGFLWSLREEGGYLPAGKDVLLLGAGGAARAVSWALAGQGIKRLVILNRSENRACLLAEKLQALFPSLSLEAALLSAGSIKHYWPQVSLAVNSLSADPIDWKVLEIPAAANSLAYDLRYSPARTEFMDWAQGSGAKPVNGLGMLIGQAALSFKLFTGVDPPFELMKKIAGRIKIMPNNG